MQLSNGSRSIHLTYCLNIHPGESVAAILDSLRRYTAPLRKRLAPGRPFGLGLRLGAQAVRELHEASVRRTFVEFLVRRGFYVFTVNAFPYGPFHGRPVREQVYAPDWSSEERVEYTRALVRLLPHLPRTDDPITISTVPGTWGPWARNEPERAESARRNLARFALELAEYREKTGVETVLALEPEPDCLWQRSDDILQLFARDLFPHPDETTMADVSADVRKALRRHLGVCLDTCHAAVEFERAAEVLQRFDRAGIRTAKVQVSAAPCADRNTPAVRAVLREFADPVYLHQTRVRRPDGALLRYHDVAQAADALAALPEACEVRTHVHIPLPAAGYRELESSRRDLDADFFRTLAESEVSHVELETYTFDVLPADLRAGGVVEVLEAEFRWFLAALQRFAGFTAV